MEEELATLERETRSSITLKRNAKGEYAWEIKEYHEEGKHMEAIGTLHTVDRWLRQAFLPAATIKLGDDSMYVSGSPIGDALGAAGTKGE